MDKPKALTAAAHKLARPIYSMLTKGEEYTDQGQAHYEERYRQRVLHNLNRHAQQLGMTLVPTAPAAQAAEKSLVRQSLTRIFLRGLARVRGFITLLLWT